VFKLIVLLSCVIEGTIRYQYRPNCLDLDSG
jgi:hypothetical protein